MHDVSHSHSHQGEHHDHHHAAGGGGSHEGHEPAVGMAGDAIRRWFRRLFATGAMAAFLVWLSTCVIFVDETEYAIVTQLGRIVAVYDQPTNLDQLDAPSDRGLHLKWPWPVQTVHYFDRRLQVLETPPVEMLTADPKNITIECYVCWKIADPPSEAEVTAAMQVEEDQLARSLSGPERQSLRLSMRPVVRFLKSLQSMETAHARLNERVGAALRNEVARIELADLVAVAHGPARSESPSGLRQVTARVMQALSGQLSRESVATAESVARMGIQVVDVRLKRFNLPEQNREAVYGRMRSERQRIVAQYTSEGESEARKIRSRAEKEAQQILAYAEATAERIRGQAEAEATRIYAQAHSRDPEFYQLLRTLEAYEKILNERTTLVLSASSPMLRLLSEGLPDLGDGTLVDQPTTPASETEMDGSAQSPAKRNRSSVPAGDGSVSQSKPRSGSTRRLGDAISGEPPPERKDKEQSTP